MQKQSNSKMSYLTYDKLEKLFCKIFVVVVLVIVGVLALYFFSCIADSRKTLHKLLFFKINPIPKIVSNLIAISPNSLPTLGKKTKYVFFKTYDVTTVSCLFLALQTRHQQIDLTQFAENYHVIKSVYRSPID